MGICFVHGYLFRTWVSVSYSCFVFLFRILVSYVGIFFVFVMFSSVCMAAASDWSKRSYKTVTDSFTSISGRDLQPSVKKRPETHQELFQSVQQGSGDE